MDWKRIEPTTEHRVGHRAIVTKTFKLPNGQVATFDTVSKENTHFTSTIALTPDNEVIIAKQFRTGPEKVMYELPGGGVEPGEDFEAAARRELLEETGYIVGSITYLGDVYKDAYSNATWHYFLASDCTPKPNAQQLDDHEIVEVELITIPALLDNARNAAMTDIEAVLLAYEDLREVQNATTKS